MGRKEGASRYNVSRDLLTHYTGIHSFKKYSEKKKILWHSVSGPGDGVVRVTAVVLLSRCLQSGREVEGCPGSSSTVDKSGLFHGSP